MKKLIIITYIAFLFLLPGLVFAQGAPPPIKGLDEVVVNLLQLVAPVGGLVAVGVMIYGGYMWIISAGDPAKIKQAQGTLTWGVIGLVFLMIFGVIIELVVDYFLG